MKHALLLGVAAAALMVSGCSSQDTHQGSTDSSESAGPDISPSAAPGVAFRYDYDFRLADERIDDVQEAHAAACERLGPSRCRITGMQYTIDCTEQVTAMLQVKLDPTIARQFGKSAAAGVTTMGGQLVSTEFVGEDEGAEIGRTSARQNDLRTRIEDLEKRLAGLAGGDRERTTLQQQLEQLRAEEADSRNRIAHSQERLAATPMRFDYHGRGGVPGFQGRNPVAESWRAFIESGATMISVLLYLVGVLLPWAVLLLLLILVARSKPARRIRSWFAAAREDAASQDVT